MPPTYITKLKDLSPIGTIVRFLDTDGKLHYAPVVGHLQNKITKEFCFIVKRFGKLRLILYHNEIPKNVEQSLIGRGLVHHKWTRHEDAKQKRYIKHRMDQFKHHKMHARTIHGHVVQNPKQAIAIALHQAHVKPTQ